MASVLDFALLGGLAVVHTFLAAVAVRFFRIRLETDLGSALYAVAFVPVLLLLSTLLVTGVLGVGPDLGSGVAVLGLLVGAPLAVGATVDLLYYPAPEEYDLPETR